MGLIFGVLVSALLAVASAASADMIETAGRVENKVYVLKHPSKGAAFVRMSDRERLERLVSDEGFEVVARRGEDGQIRAVTGEMLPEELAAAEAAAAYATRERDSFDLGAGINVGITTGGKARLVVTLDSGAMVGVDLDLGTILFVTEGTVSGLFGWSFEAGRQVIRPYLTVGYGDAVVWAILAIDTAREYHGGVGFEWKPARWVGLGLEGGLMYLDHDSVDGGAVVPWARLNLILYLF